MKIFLRYILYVFLFLLPAQLFAQATHVVISQYWGSVGSTGAPYNSNFIELYNPTTTDVNISTWSVQYKSATSPGTMNVMAFPANSIVKAHGYFLMSLASSSTPVSSNPLPTADATGATQVASSGKIALVSSTTGINVPATVTQITSTAYPTVVDFLGFGTGVDLAWEGTGAAGAGVGTSGTKCFERKANAASTATSMISTGTDYTSGNGYDSDDNASDFFLIANINPHNTASPVAPAVTSGPSVTASVTTLDFGTTQTVNTTSASKSFSLSGSLTDNAVVTTAAPYAVSKDNSNFSTSISFTPAEVSATTSPLVYVNFKPTTTTAANGSVSITSTNATTQTVTLTGTGSASVDITPPVNATGYPKPSSVATTSLNLLSNLNEAGTTYYVIIPATATAPTTAAQVKAGQDGNGNAVTLSGSFAVATANTDAVKAITGLSSATAYNIYMVSQDAAASPNLQTTFTTINITTLKLDQNITFSATANTTYGSVDFDPAATSDNSTIGITYTSSDATIATIVSNKIHIIKAGTVTITANQAGSTLYNAATAKQQVLTVNQAALNVKANSITKSFGSTLTGGANSGAFTSTGLMNNESIGSVTINYGAGSAATDAANTYTGSVVASAATGGTFIPANYNITYTAGNITVTATPIPTITTSGALSALSTIYGTASATGTFNVSGTAMTAGILVTPPTGFEVSANATTGFGPSVTVGTAGTIASTPVYVRLAATNAAGSYAGNLVLSSTGANNVTVATATSTVAQKVLTITAGGGTKVYGVANPAFTISYNGFAGTETAANLTTQPTVNTTATTASPVGNYTTVASGGVSANYSFTYVSGSLAVTPAALIVTASNTTKQYGAALPVLTPTYSGFAGTDNAASLTTQPTVTTTATATSAVGNYPTTTSGGVSANYTFTYVAGSLSVVKATLTITVSSAIKIYGAANPVLTASYTGFVGTDNALSLTTQPTLSTTATVTSPVGSYPTTATGAAGVNYTPVYVNGVITVNPAPLTISADNKTRLFGAANPTLTATYTGFVGTDNSTSLITLPTLSTTAVTNSAVGNYPISITGAAAANYSIAYVNGILTVAPLTDATLSNIKLNSGTISPAFSSSVINYIDSVTHMVYYVNLTPTTNDATATVTVNGVPVTSGKASSSMPINIGSNIVTIVVTAQDGITQKTYTVNIYKASGAESITVSNVLTPNGDGKNDNLVIKDIQLYTNNTLTVFDRGGRIVYSKHGYTNDWGGTINGAPLSEGTYYYIVDLGTTAPVIKGFITILRNR